MPINYFIYARKSTESEDRQMVSIEDQISEMKKLASEHQMNIVDVITESKSAKAPGRPKFNEMIARIESGEARGLLCWKLNRLARNPVDGGKVSWLLQEGHVEHIKTFGRDYYPQDNVLMMQVEFGMANQFVRDLSNDVKRGMRKKAERGWFPAAVLPLGYMRSHDPEKDIIPDPKTFPLIRKLWDIMLTEECSIREIHRRAAKMGLRTKRKMPYAINTFHHLFEKEFYTGYFYWRDEHGVPVRHKGKHKPMVTLSEFRKVKEILKAKSNQSRKRDYYFPYRGLISCGECNGTVTAEHKHQVICTSCKVKFSIKTKDACPRCDLKVSRMKNPSEVNKVYYHCTKNNGPCSQGSVTLPEIDEKIADELSQLKISPKTGELICNVINRAQLDDDQKSAIAHRKKLLSQAESRLSGLIKMRANAELSTDQFIREKVDTEAEILRHKEYLQTSDALEDRWKTIAQSFVKFAEDVPNDLHKVAPEAKHALARKLASNLTIRDKSLYVATNITLTRLKECSIRLERENGCFEPEMTLENQCSEADSEGWCASWLTSLRAIRTHIIENELRGTFPKKYGSQKHNPDSEQSL